MRPPVRRAQRWATVVGLLGAVLMGPVADPALAAPNEPLASAPDEPVEAVGDAVTDITDTVDDLVDVTTDTVDGLVDDTADSVDETTDALDRTVDDTTDTVDGTVDRFGDGDPGVSEPDAEPPSDAEDASAPDDAATPPSPSPAPAQAAPPPRDSLRRTSPGTADRDAADDTEGQTSPGPDGPGSVFDGIDDIGERAAFPLTLIALLAGFLAVQAWVDRRDPKLAAAPVEAEPDRVFERP